MKRTIKLLSYALPLALAAGITIGCKPDKKIANIAHKQPHPARPTHSTVTIESIYAELPEGVPTCLYDEYGLYAGSGYGIGETGFALGMTLVLQDPDGIRAYNLNSFEDSAPEERIKCKPTLDMSLRLVSPSKSHLEKHNLAITITNCKGKTSKYEYTLDDIVSKSKQFGTLIPAEGQQCPDMTR